MTNKFRLFFSWQSDDKKSREILTAALNKAVDTLSVNGIQIDIDYSTLGESGMPNIDQTILRKIDSCDIFLADITPVNNYQQTLGNGQIVIKEVPNPNVLLELGYAMSALGVEYVIVVAHQGTWIPSNMPFDINHHAIYSFTSSNCELISYISEVIQFIKNNGRHRHLDKSYISNQIERITDKFRTTKTINEPASTLESTVFFKIRIADAFPGIRGLVEYNNAKEIHRHLSKLLEHPTKFKKSLGGTNDPIWWFRAGRALFIPSYKHISGRKFVIGCDELVIRKIVAYVDPGRYYSNYVYVEAQGDNPTGLFGYYTPEKLVELKKSMGGYVNEEYAIYKPYPFFCKKITKQEQDDGSTKILGRIIKMNVKHVEYRCRFLTDYNFIIAAKGSAFNNKEFDRTSKEYFDGLLNGSITINDFHNYMMTFSKPNHWI